MRIYGGRDYYDCGLSMGIDPSIVLVRGTSRSIDVKKAGGSLLGTRLELRPEEYVLENVAVVFCDKVYHGIRAPKPIWDADRLFEWVAEKKERNVVRRQQPYGSSADRKYVEDFFTPYPAPEAVRKFMIERQISILVEQEPRRNEDRAFLVNPPILRELGFVKAVDPYTAFQELSMWIGGVLGGSSPQTVRITDDKVLAENHGYDRFSFRGPRIK